ncbi:efflux RND transporter periplasmic adaptor subunit [Herminiimonas sp. KBW02]|uniref:efflux RND transporter periplasmic adaptor subunit n=1 Tax=Herminiimonas sp. KBW02 TaxID=2153363 RepID=UPI000F5ACFD8|nr:efflux RND transporter periplasmic adaptor subunit [Herminiimonas sp. KBW02]RQO36528.1 efflux RND transporter periplasmic adaptor subunit [Herminiimonas sp. KBW02]
MKSTSFFVGLRQRLFSRRALIVLLIVLVGAASYWGWKKFYGKKDPREMYQVAEVQRGDIQDLVTATGTVQPLEYVDVGAQVSGQLKKLYIEVGSIVKAGDLLAEIDPTVFLAQVDARRAGLRNQLATMKDRESQLALATLQYNRQKNLMAADATTADSMQTAEAALRSARAQIDALQAQIEQTQSTLRADEANLNYAKIYAPMDGTVVSLTARQGQTLNANQTAPTILRIADLSTMTVQTQVSEAEVGKLRKGMEVYFTTLGSQGRRWYGALRKVEPTPTVTNNVVLYNALFDVPNKNQALLPSMTTQVFFIAATAKDALLVPTAAVTTSRGSSGRRDRSDGNDRNAIERKGTEQKDSAASDKKVADKKADAPAPLKPAVPAAANADKAKPAANPFANMTPEERRAALEKMTPEEREAMRERRRALREAEKLAETPATDTAVAAVAAKKDEAKSAKAEKSEAGNAKGNPPADAAAASSSGFAEQSSTRAIRTGTVKVIGKDGNIEQRKVELGVTNRVQMQVLSGLEEGDTIILGIKLPPSAKRPVSPANQQGGMPPGMGGPSGRSR